MCGNWAQTAGSAASDAILSSDRGRGEALRAFVATAPSAAATVDALSSIRSTKRDSGRRHAESRKTSLLLVPRCLMHAAKAGDE